MKKHYTQPLDHIEASDCNTLIRLAIEEDAPAGDPTSEAIFDPDRTARADLVTREDGVFCGASIAKYLLAEFAAMTGYKIELIPHLGDGQTFRKGDRLLSLSGSLRGILRIERPLLNFVQYLSGISSTVAKAVELAGPNVHVLDTRKTLPGYRRLAKYAVYCGGGANHRIHLSDMAMIKDNHVQAAGSISEAVRRIRAHFPDLPIDLEIDRLDQLEEALAEKPEVLLLDNMNAEQIRQAVERIRAVSTEIRIELSGGWTPEMLQSVADVGPLGVSMGYITHTTRFLDLSLEIRS